MFKNAITALALTAAMASAHSEVVLINEGFGNVGNLTGSGWLLKNESSPIGSTSWFQGDQQVFNAHTGAPESYIAANYNNAAVGGSLSTWLITPVFSLAKDLTFSFWVRGADDDAYHDQLAFALLGASGDTSTATILGVTVAPTDDWTLYTLQFGGQGAGTARFGIRYYGDVDNANYFGIDDLLVTTVPEPATWALLGVSLLGLGLTARRRSQR